MSKKSRRRNKKILATLAAIGTGLALANRGKGTEMSNIEVDSGRGGKSSSAKSRIAANVVNNASSVYPDAIMRGGKGAVIPSDLPVTSANVQKNLVEPPLKRMQRKYKDSDFYPDLDYQFAAKDGGRVSHKKGGRVKGAGCAKRGFGRAFKGGK